MSGNLRRKMNRKAIREGNRDWTYEEYARKKVEEQQARRLIEAKAKAYGELIAVLSRRVPRWILVLAATKIPPPVVTMAVNGIVRIAPQKLYRWFVEFAMLPSWLATIAVWPYDVLVSLPAYLLFTPLVMLKKILMRFGHFYSIQIREKDETIVLTVRNFFLWPVSRSTIKI